MKRTEQAGESLSKWLQGICYENGIMIDDCVPQICKGCGEGAWLIQEIKHKKGCEVAKAEKNLVILLKEGA